MTNVSRKNKLQAAEFPKETAQAWTRDSLRGQVLICAGLIVLTIAIYWQVTRFGFVALDDEAYVSANPQVLKGLSLSGAAWAFKTTYQSNWHPLTWLSLMLDAQIAGADPEQFHTTNLVLHILNGLLLFIVLNTVTKSAWRSGFVAALFAVHPLHVESVAWVAERKDVLSTLFWMLTLLTYVRYAIEPSAWRYTAALAFFALGLMAKPMLVSMPAVLMLLDYWPLGKAYRENKLDYEVATNPASGSIRFLHRVRDKRPFFALAAGSCTVTIWAQASGGTIGTLQVYPLGVRLANAAVSYVSYAGKMFWPLKLAAFYPHPGTQLPIWQVALSSLVLAGLTALAVATRRKAPYTFVGWLWYLVTLIPVIGFVQVGDQAMADRYTYIPLIGPFIAVTWAIADLTLQCQSIRWLSRLLPVCAMIVIAAFSLVSYRQAGVWKDGTALFEHAIKVTKNNDLAYNSYAYLLKKRGDLNGAIAMYRKALEINPRSAESHNGLGGAYGMLGQATKAVEHFREAIALGYDRAEVRANLGTALTQAGDYEQAVREFSVALKMAPPTPNVLRNRAFAYAQLGRHQDAARDLREALRLAPDDPVLIRVLEHLEAQSRSR